MYSVSFSLMSCRLWTCCLVVMVDGLLWTADCRAVSWGWPHLQVGANCGGVDQGGCQSEGSPSIGAVLGSCLEGSQFVWFFLE